MAVNETERQQLPEQLDIQALQRQLGTQHFGIADRMVYAPVVNSTNTIAMQLARQDAEEGVVVLTDNQTAGKGRQGRNWIDVSGCNAIVSLILRPLFPPHLLVMIASVAVVNAIAEICGIAASIKWPNDVLIQERKVAGILIETSHNTTGQLVAVVGIGVNVKAGIQNKRMAEAVLLSDIATSLENASGREVSREAFIAALLRHTETSYYALQCEMAVKQSTEQAVSHSGANSVALLAREQWRSRLSTLGRYVQVRQGDTTVYGIAEDVNDNGELLLRRHSGERVSITWGDVWESGASREAEQPK